MSKADTTHTIFTIMSNNLFTNVMCEIFPISPDIRDPTLYIRCTLYGPLCERHVEVNRSSYYRFFHSIARLSLTTQRHIKSF